MLDVQVGINYAVFVLIMSMELNAGAVRFANIPSKFPRKFM